MLAILASDEYETNAAYKDGALYKTNDQTDDDMMTILSMKSYTL